MNTTVYLDSIDLNKLKEKYEEAYIREFVKRIDSEDLSKKTIIRHVPVKDKVLVGIYMNLDVWKKLQHWLIDNSNEDKRANIRDAMLTLLE